MTFMFGAEDLESEDVERYGFWYFTAYKNCPLTIVHTLPGNSKELFQ